MTTLWVSSTTTYQTPDSTRHSGCTGPCDKTQVGRIRVVSSCTAWGDLCATAQSSCQAPADTGVQAPPGGGASADGGGGAAEADNFGYPTVAPTAPPAPSPSSEVYLFQPTMPPAELMEQDRTTTTTERTTSTLTSTETHTTTQTWRPGRTTKALTPMPGTTRPFLRPNECPMLTREQFLAAEYTPWELAFTLDPDSSYVTTEAVYASLNRALSDIPVGYFSQRPTMSEQVRLVWELTVARSNHPEWLWEYKKVYCPSAPAERLHEFLTRPENRDLMSRVRTGLLPRDIEPESFTDAGLRKAWQQQTGVAPTTARPLWEATDGSVYGGRFLTTTTLFLGYTMQPSFNVPVEQPSGDRFQKPPSMTFAFCQKARSDGGTGIPEWHQEVAACDLMPVCLKLWIVRAGLMLQMVLGLSSAMPSCLSFIGSNGAFASRFPPKVEVFCAAGSVLGLLVALITAHNLGVPVEGANDQRMDGAGFLCTVVSLLLCCLSGGLAVMANGAAEGEEVLAIDPEEIKKTPVVKHQRDFPERPAPSASADLPPALAMDATMTPKEAWQPPRQL